MNDLSETQKADLLILIDRLRDICKQTYFKLKVTKIEPTLFEPQGDLVFSQNDILTLIWDDDA